MKAVVLEIKDGFAAILSEDGQFRKINDAGYLPGMEVTLEVIDKQREKFAGKDFRKMINLQTKKLWGAAAGVAAALLVFAGVQDFNTPYSIVSLDVNPSIEISLNRYDKVLDVEAVNDDAEEIVEALSEDGVKYKSVEDAIDMALSDFEEGDYEAEDDQTYIMMSVNSGSEKHSEKIKSKIQGTCEKYENISAQAITADDELVVRAKESGTTAGKLYLVESLKDMSEEDVDTDEWLKKPVKDIMSKIEDVKSAEPVQDAPEKPEGMPDEEATTKPAIEAPENNGEPNSIPEENGEAPNSEIPEKPSDEDMQDADVPEKPAENGEEPKDGGNIPENIGKPSEDDENAPLDGDMQNKPADAKEPPDAGQQNQSEELKQPPEGNMQNQPMDKPDSENFDPSNNNNAEQSKEN